MRFSIQRVYTLSVGTWFTRVLFVFWQILDSLGLYMTDDQFRILSAR